MVENHRMMQKMEDCCPFKYIARTISLIPIVVVIISVCLYAVRIFSNLGSV